MWGWALSSSDIKKYCAGVVKTALQTAYYSSNGEKQIVYILLYDIWENKLGMNNGLFYRGAYSIAAYQFQDLGGVDLASFIGEI